MGEDEKCTQDQGLFLKKYNALTHNNRKNPIEGEFYHIFIHKVVEKLNEGLAPTIAIVGKQGLGKSMTAMRIGEILHHEVNAMAGDFNPESQLVYDVLPFLERIHDITPPKEDGKPCPEREVFIFDEGGVNLASVDWRSQENRGVQEVLQTMRIKNCVYIFVLPEINKLDKQARENLDFIVTMKDIGKAYVKGIKYNHDRLDNKYRRFYVPYGFWDVDKPVDGIVESYRKVEIPNKNKFIEERIEKIKEKRKEEAEEMDVDDLI